MAKPRPAAQAMLNRRSVSRVSEHAPNDEELAGFVQAAASVADHASLRPWRLITLRGSERDILARALNKAHNKPGLSSKPTRAPLLIAVVADYRKSSKVPEWEQLATASGVAHLLSLVLDEAGYGVMWRTGDVVEKKAVRRAHRLKKNQQLLGWLYVGEKLPRKKPQAARKEVSLKKVLTTLSSQRED